MRYITTSGGELKSADFGNPIRDSWDFVEAMKDSGDVDLYARVSALNRAMNLTADAIANLPFAVTNAAGTEDLDTSEKWQNKIGVLPHPRQLLRQWRLSLFTTNTAYGRIAKTNAIKKQMFYVLPESIEIETDKKTGQITGYARKMGGMVVDRYKPDDKNLLKMWRLDHTTELLPSENTEFLALANSAGILYAADWWTKNYFKNGAVKPTVISVKGMVIGDKKDELQSSWAQFMRGIGRGLSDLAKIINGEAMDVKQIGDGLGDVKDSPVYKQAIENICMVSGIPLSVMLSNSANFATAQTEYASWFRDSIVPWAYWMQEQLNEQIFIPAGMRFEFRPEQTEPAQEEEVQRASAYQTYINAGMKPSLAAQVVGIDLPAGYEYEMLDPMEKEDTPADVVEDTTEELVQSPSEDMSAKAWEELDTWKRKAVRHSKRGQPITFEFETKHIPTDIADSIRERLSKADNTEAVKAAFVAEVEEVDTEIQALADAINKAAEKMAVKESPIVNVLLKGRARWLALAQETEAKTYDYFLLELERMIYNVYNGSLGGSFIDIMANLISGQIRQAYQKAWIDNGYQLPIPPYMAGAADAMILNQYDYVDGLYRAIIDARVDGTSIEPLMARAKLWAARWNEAYQDGVRLITEQEGGNMIWVLGEAEHCNTCRALSGIVASAREWTVIGIAPKSPRLACGGYNCKCELQPTTKRRSPNAYGRIEEALLA